jgi:hypothetical protein
MTNLLRVMIIVLLVLSVAALTLGVMLFYQRDVLKNRAQVLESSVVKLAGKIEAETAEDLATTGLPTMDTKITANQLMSYYVVDPQTGQKSTSGPGTMQEALNGLIARADVQYTRLGDTRTTLTQTRQTLAETKAEKERVEGELAAEKQITKQQAEKIDALNTDIENKKQSIAELEEKNKGLQELSDNQKKEIDELKDKNAELAASKKTADELIRKLQIELVHVRGDTEQPPLSPGLKGQVLLVNPDWNFVILGIARDSDVAPAAELIVHRHDQFVGKILVSEVKTEANLAVAEILSDWQKQTIQEGDDVIY